MKFQPFELVGPFQKLVPTPPQWEAVSIAGSPLVTAAKPVVQLRLDDEMRSPPYQGAKSLKRKPAKNWSLSDVFLAEPSTDGPTASTTTCCCSPSSCASLVTCAEASSISLRVNFAAWTSIFTPAGTASRPWPFALSLRK